MPTRMHLEIHSGTRLFHKLFRYEDGSGDFSLYARSNQYGGAKIVCIYRSSAKCYRVMYMDRWYVREYGMKCKSEYLSFRTLLQLCAWLDSIV